MNIRDIIENTVSISQFNRGLAGKIFDEVKKSGAKVVIKHNMPECILLSPEEYIRLLDDLNDAKLLNIATQRMKAFDTSKLISQEQIDKEFGLAPADYENVDDIEIE